MSRLTRLAGALLALAGAAAAAPPQPENDPASYAVRLPVLPAPNAVLQRIELPAAIVAAAHSADLDDLRLFNAAGRPLPIARTTPAAAPPTSHPLTPLPILAAAADLQVTGLSLQIDAAGQPRLASVSGTPSATRQAVTVGYLFDARAIGGTATRLTLDADIPAGQPVTITVEAGRTLDAWRPIGAQVIYRAPGAAATAVTLPLADARLEGGYLRVGWRSAGRLLGPVTIRRATLLTGGGDGGPVFIDAIPPAPFPPAGIAFVAPFAVPVTAVEVTPRGGEALVPFRMLGRNDQDHGWTALAAGVAGSGTPIAVTGGDFRMFRMAADGVGFAAPPAIRLGVAPRAILFLASGPGPYTLAVGRPGTAGSYMSAAMLTAGRGAAVSAAVTAPAPQLHLVAPDTRSARARTILLWTVLVAATAALAALAWLIWRRLPAA